MPYVLPHAGRDLHPTKLLKYAAHLFDGMCCAVPASVHWDCSIATEPGLRFPRRNIQSIQSLRLYGPEFLPQAVAASFLRRSLPISAHDPGRRQRAGYQSLRRHGATGPSLRSRGCADPQVNPPERSLRWTTRPEHRQWPRLAHGRNSLLRAERLLRWLEFAMAGWPGPAKPSPAATR